MNVHWEHKKKRSGGMSNPQIDEWYDLARANGALGGKLIGAGGGGFLMFYAEDKTQLRHALREAGLRGGALPLRLRGHQGADAIRVTAPALSRSRSSPAGSRRGCGRSPRRSRSRWSTSPDDRSSRTSSPARARRASTDVVFCVGHLGEQIEEELGDGAALGLRRPLRPSTADGCSAPAARCAARCRCWTVRVLRALRRLVPACDLDDGGAARLRARATATR